MGCDQPLNAWYSKDVGPRGKRRLTFNRNAAFSPSVIKIACGQCMGCRLEKSRQWAVRCMHEYQLWKDNCFVTLTYDNKNLPEGGTLVRSDPQLFLKRLRHEYGAGIRFYGCGEYGTRTNRPHYHFILFNHDFKDKKVFGHPDNKLWCSGSCYELWPFGQNVIGEVTFESCAYVSRYVASKIVGAGADSHYGGRLPEFSMMSRRPGIGAGWFEKFGAHAYEWDSVISRGREVKPPRFYDNRYELLDSDRLALLKSVRRRKAMANKADNTSARRHVKEEVLRLSLKAKTEV